MRLMDDYEIRRKAKDNIENIMNHLDHIEKEDSLLMSKWLLTKSEYYFKHAYRKGFGQIPRDIERGDIVRVEFGMNIGDELSDNKQDKHFALVWAQKGFLFLVIPLTKTPQTGNEYAVNLGEIEGMPISTDTYAKVEGMRSISIRRIKMMREHPSGKISIKDNEELMGRIKDKLIEVLIN